MIQEQQVILRKLVPDVDGNWLYKQDGEQRIFSQCVYLGKEASADEWTECTVEDKEKWEREHSEPEPEPSDE